MFFYAHLLTDFDVDTVHFRYARAIGYSYSIQFGISYGNDHQGRYAHIIAQMDTTFSVKEITVKYRNFMLGILRPIATRNLYTRDYYKITIHPFLLDSIAIYPRGFSAGGYVATTWGSLVSQYTMDTLVVRLSFNIRNMDLYRHDFFEREDYFGAGISYANANKYHHFLSVDFAGSWNDRLSIYAQMGLVSDTTPTKLDKAFFDGVSKAFDGMLIIKPIDHVFMGGVYSTSTYGKGFSIFAGLYREDHARLILEYTGSRIFKLSFKLLVY